ncbi:hypothetical protein E2F46_06195 [Luteimonas aestuarii]|uniref:Uncharacterized protein n=1 Tax=Luteimonas aestuarii TaxID=453837 RepID=A0A4R5TYA6_9GAMM|nr:hypothetical protein [Luteimonas aestuarii]TDK26185.1 hypothetical protein E2F46_06195 [Luteimonas aestuarii]
MSEQNVDETPWEVSVFTALLNMRWVHLLKSSSQRPDLVIALDHAAETALGDVVLKADDRLFLFELKASWERANTEKNKPIFGLYEKLHSSAHSTSIAFDELLSLSIRCHHLVYWEDDVRLSDGNTRGSISFSPYALFVLDQLYQPGRYALDLRLAHAISLRTNDGETIVEAAPIEAMFNGSATAVNGDLSTGDNVEAYKLGLGRNEFLDFVQHLRKEIDGSADIALKLIAFSPESGFVRRISSLQEAVQLGVDWAKNTASAKPARSSGHRRTGKPRSIGTTQLRIVCAPTTGARKPRRP